MKLVDMGKLRGYVGATFPLEEARNFSGKIVLTM